MVDLFHGKEIEATLAEVQAAARALQELVEILKALAIRAGQGGIVIKVNGEV